MKMLITSATFAPGMDGPVMLDANSFAELDADVAVQLAACGRALYIDPKDDPSRRGNASGTRTATAEQIAAADAAGKAAAKAAKTAAKTEG